MNHEAEHHGGIAIGPRGPDLVEALLETGTQVEASEEGLKQDQAGEGGELLIFEADLGETAGFTFYLSSAKLHGGGLHGLAMISLARMILTQMSRLFIFFSCKSLPPQTSPAVRLREEPRSTRNACPDGFSSCLTVFPMQLEGTLGRNLFWRDCPDWTAKLPR